MRLPRGRPDPAADPHPGKRGRSGVGSLVIMLAIAAVALIAFLLYDGGWSTPPDEAVTAEGDPPGTSAPSQTEPAEPNTGEGATPEDTGETAPSPQQN